MGGRHARDLDDAAMSVGLRTAWGRPLAARGPRPTLSLDAIVRAGVDVAATEGLPAVSMARVASQLGGGTMSLYRHVGSKEELLALMVDAVLADPPGPLAAGEGWRAALERWARAHLTVLQQHPWAVRVPIAGPPIMPNQVRWFEWGLACLESTGLSEPEKVHVLLLLNGFVRNEASLAADLAAAGAADPASGATYARRLRALAGEERFPALARLLASGVFERREASGSAFEFGLARLLDGIAALTGSRPKQRR